MTGRPSGRCAAREALKEAHGFVRTGGPLFKADRLELLELLSAALASPCCVSAADQEQVKAWRALAEEARGMDDVCAPSVCVAPTVHVLADALEAALALLGSHEEEER